MAEKIEKTLLSGLNPQQIEAVCNTGGHTLVFAGAGSGKTRVLTTRIAFLVLETGTPPKDILAVTFTNKAASEMRERVEAVLPGGTGGIWLGTFHSICARILRADIEKMEEGYGSNFVIYDTGDQVNLIKRCLAARSLSDESGLAGTIRFLIERFKRDGVFPPTPQSFRPDEKNVGMKLELINDYDEEMKKSNALDFNDLLMLTDRLFSANKDVLKKYRERFRHILIDEYQDTNSMQYRFVRMLGEDNAEVFAVGDDSQSIYAWRGAELKNILRFSENFKDAKVVRLTQNYRSTANIIKASNALISNNRVGEKKEMWTDGDDGEKIRIYGARNDFDEADFVVAKIKTLVDEGEFSPGDFAVLYRTNSRSRLLEQRFTREPGISCVVVGALSFFARAEIKDLISYLRLLANPSDDAAVARIINTPPRGIGGVTFDKLSAYAAGNKISIMDAARSPEKEGFLGARAAAAVGKFVEIMDSLSARTKDLGTAEAIKAVIEKSGYGEILEKDEDRGENVDELLNAAHEFDSSPGGAAGFRGFVENVALASDTDTETGGDRVKLMTLHASKGLEFPVVFITGMSDGLVPLSRVLNRDPEELEEERRLCYVGMTRAMKRLFMSYPRERRIYGGAEMVQTEVVQPSRFFEEIPGEFVEYDQFYSGSITVDAEPAPGAVYAPPPGHAAAGGFAAGGYVRHDKFGRGKIVKVEGGGPNAAVTVIFPKSGRKRILASFLKAV